MTDGRTECKPIVPSGFTGGGLIIIVFINNDLVFQVCHPTDPRHQLWTCIIPIEIHIVDLIQRKKYFVYKYMPRSKERL